MPIFVKVHDFAPRYFEILDEPLMIGRLPEATISLHHPTISRRHAVIQRREGRLCVVDLQSSCGIYVNGMRAAGPTRLEVGDQIRVGQLTLEIVEREA